MNDSIELEWLVFYMEEELVKAFRTGLELDEKLAAAKDRIAKLEEEYK